MIEYNLNIEGMEATLKFLQDELKRVTPTHQVQVGYTANYAIYVHEDLEAYHPVGQAKYLEQPARTMDFQRIVDTVLNRGGTGNQALVAAGLALQRESQKLVPVDTGNLKNSAFTKKAR